LDSKYKDTKDE